MTKGDFIKKLKDSLPEDMDLSLRELTDIFNTTFDVLVEVVKKEEKFMVPGFGTFKIKKMAKREGINPRTKEKITIPARNSLSFKVAPKLKDNLN